MKYGIYFAYWTKEWFADYKKYMDKVSALGLMSWKFPVQPSEMYTQPRNS